MDLALPALKLIHAQYKNLLLRLGVSPAPIPYRKVSEETLAAAIEIVLGDKVMRCKAQELGQKLRGEDGVANAVEAFHRHLGLLRDE
jgi:UDP:flavonoid glycosyltransferase YjiC (YdhE family)